VKKRPKESKGQKAESPCWHATLKTASEFPGERLAYWERSVAGDSRAC
jgi:hypothetical protein